MAGHSHWANIKHKKERDAKKRSAAFTRAAKQIMAAIREGGPNPESNSALRAAIEYALSVNMPKDNINRLIKKASGELEASNLHIALYEAYGPGQVPMLMEAVSDNLNRTVNELRNIFAESGGILAEKGAVVWNFKEIGLIKFKAIKQGEKRSEEECVLEILDLGDIEDVVFRNEECNVIVSKNKVADISKKIEALGYKVIFAGRYFWPVNTVKVNEEQQEKLRRLIEQLEELPEIQNIWYALDFVL